jgi:molybdopterin-guanine dinucleotide biosynthesis protein A
MGIDKATLVVEGKPMAVRVADAMWEAGCHPVECQGGDAPAIAEYGLDVVPDREPGQGPVAAIRDALARHPDRAVVVAACDLVDLRGDTIRALLDAASSSDGVDVAVAASGGDRHLICWWRAGVADRIDELVGAGVSSFRGTLSQLHTIDVEVDPSAIRNVNTPTDLVDRG